MIAPRTYRLSSPDLLCPTCGTLLSAATTVIGDNDAPKAGDLTICASCASVLSFEGGEGEPASLRVLTVEELDALPPDLGAGLGNTVATLLVMHARGIPGCIHVIACQWCQSQGVAVGAPDLDTVHTLLRGRGWTIFVAPDTCVIYECPNCVTDVGSRVS